MNHPPVISLPWAVWLLVIAIAGIELVLWAGAHGLVNHAGAAGWRVQALVALGITPELQGWMLTTGQTPPEHIARYFGFGFVHMGPAQALLVVVITAALGKFCADRLGSWRVLVVLALAQALGGFAFGLVAPAGAWLIGGYPLIFALAGCYTWLQWHSAQDGRARALAFALIGALVLARLALVLLAGGGMDWIADLVACAAGFALAASVTPGMVARLRR